MPISFKWPQYFSKIKFNNSLVWAGIKTAIHKVTGVPPLILHDAVEQKIVGLTQYGKCVQDGTPTPNAPVNIKCNNGTLAFVSEGVPSEYVRLEYLEATGTQYISTGMQISPQTKYVMRYTPTTGTWIAGYTAGSNGRWGLAYNPTTEIMTFYSSKSNITVPMPVAYTEAIFDFGVGVTYNGETYRFDNTPATTGELFGWLFKAQGSSASSGSKVYYFAIYQGNEKVQELIPCRRKSDGVLGMYDTVTSTFFTNDGTGTFVAGPVIGQVKVVGTSEVISLCGNLYDSNSVVTEKFVRAGNISEINPLGSEFENSAWNCSDYIAVKPNTTYTTIVPSQLSAGGAGLVFFANTTVESAISGVTATAQNAATEYSFTTPSGCKYLRFSWASSGGTDAMLYENSQVQTASVENLFAVDDYKDEQGIMSGGITRKVGIKVFDGTETWTAGGTSGTNDWRFTMTLKPSSNTSAEYSLCTHIDRIVRSSAATQTERPCIRFNPTGTTLIWYSADNTESLADFKAFLADQYAAGAPVILIYPLATETTEQVARQSLSTVEGTNAINITAEIDGIELECTYIGT